MSEQNIMDSLPFYNLTPIEYFDIILNQNDVVRNLMCNTEFMDFLHKSLPNQINEGINCKFWNEYSFNQDLKKFDPKLAILHLNICSFNKHCLELNNLLQCMDVDFSIIALTEIGKCNIENCAGFLKNHELYYDPSTLKFGGAALLINKQVEVVGIRQDLDIKKYGEPITNIIENIWVECKHKNLNKNIIVGVIYRHPNSAITEFTNLLDKILHTT